MSRAATGTPKTAPILPELPIDSILPREAIEAMLPTDATEAIEPTLRREEILRNRAMTAG